MISARSARTLPVLAVVLVAALMGGSTSVAHAAFGVAPGSFLVDALDSAGMPETQAGAHPFEVHTSFALNVAPDETVEGLPKTLHFELPEGFVGNPQTTAKCAREVFQHLDVPKEERVPCPTDSQVGLATVYVRWFGGTDPTQAPVYNLEPARGHTAQLGMQVESFVPVIIDATVDTAGDYQVVADIKATSEGKSVVGAKMELWGTPNDEAHDSERFCGDGGAEGETCATESPRKPFLTNPTACTGPLRASMTVDSWQEPGVIRSAEYETAGMQGCEKLTFDPSISIRPDSNEADSPTGLSVDLAVPQDVDPQGFATSTLKKAVVTLPQGMAVNPSSAAGLGACSEAQIGLDSDAPVACPESSKIGSVSIETPLLSEPLEGSIYLAKQGENRFGSTLALYFVLAQPARGLLIKLAGRVAPDPSTGQLVTTFDDQPQLPFSNLHVEFNSGPRAPLLNPPSCGTYTASAELSPWSGQSPTTVTDSFPISRGPNGGPCPSGQFDPKLSAGTTNPLSGTFSPFELTLSRADGTETLKDLQMTLPQGLTGRLAGIPYCPEASLASLPSAEGTAAGELASPACPIASQIGTVSAAAGAGTNPFLLRTGKAYLAGPYKGAPLSMAVITPAVAGPFDLGNVLVRVALRVDPRSTEVTAVSDPLPQILHGIPLDLREIGVDLNRPEFILNPTSCDPMSIIGTATSPTGKSAGLSERFQVGSCERLRFKPRLSLSIKGATKRSGHPKLRAELRAKPGQANIGRVSVTMPHSMFLAQDHLDTICTRVQFAAGTCPRGSIYGRARAFTPLLDRPLEGPVYLRANGGERELPDLVAALHGQIDIELMGYIDSVDGGIRTRFQNVPDAPVSKFVLNMKGSEKSLLENSRNLCRSGTGRATVKMDGQNGKVHDFRPLLKSSCGKKKKAERRRAAGTPKKERKDNR